MFRNRSDHYRKTDVYNKYVCLFLCNDKYYLYIKQPFVSLSIIEESFPYFYIFQNNFIIISYSPRSWIYSDYLILNVI